MGTSSYSGDLGPATSAGFTPQGVCGDLSGNVFITDASGIRVRQVGISGIISTYAGSGTLYSGDGGPATSAGFNPTTYACSVEPSTDNLFLATGNDFRVRKVDGNSKKISTVAGVGSGSASTGDDGPASSAMYRNCVSIFVDSVGKLYIAEYFGNKVKICWFYCCLLNFDRFISLDPSSQSDQRHRVNLCRYWYQLVLRGRWARHFGHD